MKEALEATANSKADELRKEIIYSIHILRYGGIKENQHFHDYNYGYGHSNHK